MLVGPQRKSGNPIPTEWSSRAGLPRSGPSAPPCRGANPRPIPAPCHRRSRPAPGGRAPSRTPIQPPAPSTPQRRSPGTAVPLAAPSANPPVASRAVEGRHRWTYWSSPRLGRALIPWGRSSRPPTVPTRSALTVASDSAAESTLVAPPSLAQRSSPSAGSEGAAPQSRRAIRVTVRSNMSVPFPDGARIKSHAGCSSGAPR